MSQTQTGTSNGTGVCGQKKKKKNKSFLAANTKDGFSTNKDNMYHTSTVKYTAVLLMLCACFSSRGPEHLVQMHGIMDSIKYQQMTI